MSAASPAFHAAIIHRPPAEFATTTRVCAMPTAMPPSSFAICHDMLTLL